MKFLVDAQLPARLAKFLTGKGHDAIHSSDLPDGNRTPDSEIALRADEDGRVVVTKDRDFRDTHLLHRTPRRLLVVATGTSATGTYNRSSPRTYRRSSMLWIVRTTSSYDETSSSSMRAKAARKSG